MDAYSNYILKASEARAAELRREAAEHALSRTARRNRTTWRTKAGARLRRQAPDTVVAPPATVSEGQTWASSSMPSSR